MYNTTTIGQGLGDVSPSRILAWGLGARIEEVIEEAKFLISEYTVIVDKVLSYTAKILKSKSFTAKLKGDC